jgi:hypothetical protein
MRRLPSKLALAFDLPAAHPGLHDAVAEMNVLVMILANEHARHGWLKATRHRCRMAA